MYFPKIALTYFSYTYNIYITSYVIYKGVKAHFKAIKKSPVKDVFLSRPQRRSLPREHNSRRSERQAKLSG